MMMMRPLWSCSLLPLSWLWNRLMLIFNNFKSNQLKATAYKPVHYVPVHLAKRGHLLSAKCTHPCYFQNNYVASIATAAQME